MAGDDIPRGVCLVVVTQTQQDGEKSSNAKTVNKIENVAGLFTAFVIKTINAATIQKRSTST